MIDLVFGRRLTFQSPLARDAVEARLQTEIAPPRFFSRGDPTHQFEGTFAEGRFRIVRQVRGRHSFRSVVSGTVSSGARGARVDVRLQLHPAVLIICAIIVMFGGLIASIAVPEYLSTGSSPALVFVLGLAGVFVAFAIVAAVEARKAIRMLAALFETKPAPWRSGDVTT